MNLMYKRVMPLLYAPQGTSYTVTQYTEVIQPTLIDLRLFCDKDGIDQNAGMHNTIHIEDNDTV